MEIISIKLRAIRTQIFFLNALSWAAVAHTYTTIRIMVRNQPGQIVHETLSQKYLSQKRASRVAQGVGPEFKLPYHKEKKQKQKNPLHYYAKYFACISYLILETAP
jgi:coenzyme F420-reducing hydrogenase beta subunit